MRRLVLAFLLSVLPVPAPAQPVQMAALNPAAAALVEDVARTAERLFTAMPQVRLTSAIRDICGGGAETSTLMRYCTSQNAIFVASDIGTRLGDPAAAAYLLAHMYGHAVQVRHGQADRAQAAIAAAPGREPELRGMVTAQVECIAGFLFAQATGRRGVRLSDWFASEPFADAHWGREPLYQAPIVSIGLAAREAAFLQGQRAGDIGACAVGALGADRLLRALR